MNIKYDIYFLKPWRIQSLLNDKGNNNHHYFQNKKRRYYMHKKEEDVIRKNKEFLEINMMLA